MYTFNQIGKAIYATWLTNRLGFKLRGSTDKAHMRHWRLVYSETLLDRLGIRCSYTGLEKIDPDGQYLILSNHRSVIDPLIIEIAFKDTNILGHWVAKTELYNSFFFGVFVRNAGTIKLDREAKTMSSLFTDIKTNVDRGDSISIFPEGTRNKTDQPLGEFKKGSNIIVRKSKLNILPVYIKTNANQVLMDSLRGNTDELNIEVEIGDVIDYKETRAGIEDIYKSRFGIV